MPYHDCKLFSKLTTSLTNKSSTTLYFLLFSKVIARASLTAVQRLIRDVSDFSELAAAAVDNPLKIKLQLCLLSALRPREHRDIISNRRWMILSHCKPALASACFLIWDIERARGSTASWSAGPRQHNCAAIDVATDAVHQCLMESGTIKCQGLCILSQGSIQSACNLCKHISWSNQKSSMPGVLKQRGGPTLHRQLPGPGPCCLRNTEVSAAPCHAVIRVDQRRIATLGCDALGA